MKILKENPNRIFFLEKCQLFREIFVIFAPLENVIWWDLSHIQKKTKNIFLITIEKRDPWHPMPGRTNGKK